MPSSPTIEPTIEHCPNCGAPLQLDVAGTCHWCGQHVTMPGDFDVSGLSPADAAAVTKVDRHDDLDLPGDVVMLPLPAFPLLACLDNCAYDLAVQPFLGAPDRLPSVQALALAAHAAGQRLQDADTLNDDVVQHGEKIYTPEEWWTFDLLADLIAMLGSIDGIERDTRSAARECVHLHDDMWADRIRKALKHSGPGPQALQPLRASIPHRPH